MRLTILSRASDLAQLQAMSVERALLAAFPELHIQRVHRPTLGDRDQQGSLTTLTDKGAFTADLSDALASGAADIVVHSWKDLPLDGRPETEVAGTLERADPRDVLLVRRNVVELRPASLTVLSSSPRRTWLLEQVLPDFLPWRVERVSCVPVRGNIPTRLAKLIAGDGDALVMAKAALDRLLGFGPPFDDVADRLREMIARTCWMVLPLRELPGAPAQGALAIEIKRGRADVAERVRAITHTPTRVAVDRERDILAGYGGGCHQAVGATVLVRDYGVLTSVRAKPHSGGVHERWMLESESAPPPAAAAAVVWPRPDERQEAVRRALDVAQPGSDSGYWVARANALPESWRLTPDRIVWAAGTKTWRALAKRGVWVHGSADGLGDDEAPAIDLLAGRTIRWQRLTHAEAGAVLSDAGDALATYEVTEPLPADLLSRTHFFWTSGSLFLRALRQYPELATRWHASGPGRTRRVIQEALGPGGRTSVWLDRDDWYMIVTR